MIHDGHSSITDWLLTTANGHCALREALCYLPEELVAEFLERWRPIYVLVKCYRDGAVEVFGPDCVQPRVVWLGRQNTFPEHEIERDQHLDETLEERYRNVHWPRHLRMSSHLTDYPTELPLFLCSKD